MSEANDSESDPRFPSGAWTGYFLDRRMPGRHDMELTLTFRQGRMSGDGRDRVGSFSIAGHYDISDGTCSFVKQYQGAHAIDYRGFNEGKGIWGTWTFPGTNCSGGFHIWPVDWGNPSLDSLEEEADAPNRVDVVEPELAPVGK